MLQDREKAVMGRNDSLQPFILAVGDNEPSSMYVQMG